MADCKSLSQIEITLECGDAVVTGGIAPSPELLIIDAEGHEAEVIHGMKATIQKTRPLIALEHLFLTDSVLWSVLPKGYKLYTACDSTGRMLEGLVRQQGHNSIMIPQGKVILKKIHGPSDIKTD